LGKKDKIKVSKLLKSLYLIVWMDGVVFKVREGSSRVINKIVYMAVGLRETTKKRTMYAHP